VLQGDFCILAEHHIQAIIELRTGSQMPTPLEWPFSQETNQEQSTDTRLSECPEAHIVQT